MPLSRLTPTDTRSMFRPVSAGLSVLLRGLSAAEWQRPTLAGSWVVRDVAAHLLDVTLRRLSFHRDGMTPPPPRRPIQSERDFVAFINGLNAEWIAATRRLSPEVLTSLYERAGLELADWFEAQPLEGPALFGVSWAGEPSSINWFDIGREFTELWHHQQQIRLAVGADSLADPRYLHAVIAIAVRGLPHAYRNVEAPAGQTLLIDIAGPAGGQWTLTRDLDRWAIAGGAPEVPTAHIRLADDAAWKLLFNALPEEEASRVVTVTGSDDLARPLLRARTVIV